MQGLHDHHALPSSMCLVNNNNLNQFDRVATGMNRASCAVLGTFREMRIATRLAIAAGRLTGIASRRLRLGGGTSAPGLVALPLAPGLISRSRFRFESGLDPRRRHQWKDDDRQVGCCDAV